MASTTGIASAATTASKRTKEVEKQEPVSTIQSLLCHWDHLPEWQRDNHYIHNGYVRETNSLTKCVQSLTYLHNETVNIYSHLVPSATVISMLLVVLFMLGAGALSLISLEGLHIVHPYISIYPTTDWPDYTAGAIFLAGVSICLGLSAAFHTLKSHSDAIATFGNKLDYLGIVVLIMASMVSLVYYSFHDHYALQVLFWALTCILGFACGVVSLSSKFRRPEWRTFRASMFVAFGLSGTFPLAVSLYIHGFGTTWTRMGLGWLLAEAGLYIGGAAIYAARVPERFTPGSFDYFGHSHQIFHVMVVLAAICHGVCLVKSYDYAHTH